VQAQTSTSIHPDAPFFYFFFKKKKKTAFWQPKAAGYGNT
jgi:hypothetical protein